MEYIVIGIGLDWIGLDLELGILSTKAYLIQRIGRRNTGGVIILVILGIYLLFINFVIDLDLVYIEL